MIFCFGRLFAPNLLKDLEWALDLSWFKFGLDQNKASLKTTLCKQNIKAHLLPYLIVFLIVVFMVRFNRP